MLSLLILQTMVIGAFAQVNIDTVALKEQPLKVAKVTVKADTRYRDTQRWKETNRITRVEERSCDLDLAYPVFQLKAYPKANRELNAVVHDQIFKQEQPPADLAVNQFCRDGIVGYTSAFQMAVFPDKPVIALRITTTADPINVPQTPVSKTWHYHYGKNKFLGFPDFFDSNKHKELIALLRSRKEALSKNTPIGTDQFFIDQQQVTFYQDHRLLGAITVSIQALKAEGIWILGEDDN